jgi:hypothetical protein
MGVNKSFNCDLCEHPADSGITFLFEKILDERGGISPLKVINRLTDESKGSWNVAKILHICSTCVNKIDARAKA